MTTNESEMVARLLELALERGAIRYGDFTLSSGRKSAYYFDGRLISLDPEGAYLLGHALLPLLAQAGVGAVGGPTLGARILSWPPWPPHRGSRARPSPRSSYARKPRATGWARLIEGPLPPAGYGGGHRRRRLHHRGVALPRHRRGRGSRLQSRSRPGRPRPQRGWQRRHPPARLPFRLAPNRR